MKKNQKKHGDVFVKECYDLPKNPDKNTIYRLLPKNVNEDYYRERTDRNIGWITREEQKMLRTKTIGVAGCGGMGGSLTAILLRLGIGEIRLADIEDFDTSNINRQFAAMRSTIGKNKAFETAKMLRQITDDTTIVVYPMGIYPDSPESVEHFVKGCDVICDQIEFWAVAARIILHQKARPYNVPIFNCNTVGFSTHIFLYTPTSCPAEEIMGITFGEALALQRKIQNKKANQAEINRVMERMIRIFVPELPSYFKGNRTFVRKRLREEGKASIICPNPHMAGGFFADRVLLHLLSQAGFNKRDITDVPEMPGYLYFDAARMKVKVVRGKWW